MLKNQLETGNESMSILTGLEIKKQVELGRIKITPYSDEFLNPNSYDLTLSPVIIEVQPYTQDKPVRVGDPETVKYLKTNYYPDEDIILFPGKFYLAATNEVTETDYYVPLLEGKSSLARYGVTVHMSAGFGDIGFVGTWTLEISVLLPTVLKPNMRIAQISFTTPEGDTGISYKKTGRYNYQIEPTPSRIIL
jgi:dCTP deaminase